MVRIEGVKGVSETLSAINLAQGSNNQNLIKAKSSLLSFVQQHRMTAHNHKQFVDNILENFR